MAWGADPSSDSAPLPGTLHVAAKPILTPTDPSDEPNDPAPLPAQVKQDAKPVPVKTEAGDTLLPAKPQFSSKPIPAKPIPVKSEPSDPSSEAPLPWKAHLPAKQAPGKADISDQPPVKTPLPAKPEKVEPEQAGPPPVGDPLAPGKMILLQQEIASQIRARHIETEFAQWCAYMGNRLDVSAGRYTGSELTGNCRLSWYERMMRHPLAAPAEAERFTRELHQAVLGGDRGFAEVLRTAREKLDLRRREVPLPPAVDSPKQAIETLKQTLINVQADYAASLSPLTKSEIKELSDYLYPVFVGNNIVGHTLNDRNSAKRLCDLMEKMDRGAMQSAAEDLLPLMAPDFLKQLAAIPEEGNVMVPGVTGRVLQRIDTPAGAIIIGGRGKNIYRLDDMPDVAAVIDLGGDDEYYEGTVNISRPLLVIIDLKGNDVYRGTRPGIQGGAILGVSLLMDLEGNDIYDARDVAQGSALVGVGILIDGGGNDIYQAARRVQAHAIGGLGILVDRGGDDQYRCVMWGQGFGGPLGFGMLDDISGDDYYYAGGVYRDSYPETPGYEGWAQGVGAGIRQVADGGIGVLLDGSGDDVYEFDYLSHGGGYWCGLGFLRDFAGNDQHLGSTKKMYNGAPRGQPDYQRFGCGWGCHYAMGFLFDDSGNDVYRGTIMGLGFGWDCSLGVLCDFGGNDRYDATGNTVQGNGAQASMGILYDYDGDDEYVGYGQGYASPSISYHHLPQCGGNFSFVVDYGGNDQYGCGAQNNSITQRGWAGGFIIDRPRTDETAQDSDASEKDAKPSAVQTAGRQ
jgi:hypothetical protein